MMKVLLVDDEPWVLEGLRTMVNWDKYGFEICGEALNGRDALRLTLEYKPVLVLTDIHIPVFNGLEVIEQLNQMMKKPPKFVILSGYDDFKYARTAMRQRVNEYLLKPIDEEEIEDLLAKLSAIIRDEISAEQTHNKKQAYLLNNTINRLIQGEYNSHLEHQLEQLMNLQGEEELVCILIEEGSYTYDVQQLCEENFPQMVACFFLDGTGKTGIIIQVNSMVNDELDGMDTFQRNLMNWTNQSILVALSKRMVGIRSIREMYMQAMEVWKHKSNQHKTGVYCYSEINKIKKRDEVQEENFKKLVEQVVEFQQEGIERCIREAFDSFSESLLDIEIIKIHVTDLELTLCRLIAGVNGDPDIFMKQIELEHGHLSEIDSYVTLKKYVIDLSTQATDYISELKHQNEGNTIYNIIQYVDREFCNKLQLQDLARHFHMNSTYLGQLFKKHTGKRFNEYINEKRIEEAKRLLKRTQMKISDVAIHLGYSNTDYFIDKFKMITGVVPSVYKNRNINKSI